MLPRFAAVALVVLAALVTLVMNTVLFVVPALEACSPTFFEYTIDAACVVHAIFLICIFLYDIVEPAVHSAMRSLRMPSPRRRRSNHRSRGCSCASSSVSAAPTAPLSLLQQLSPDEVRPKISAKSALLAMPARCARCPSVATTFQIRNARKIACALATEATELATSA